DLLGRPDQTVVRRGREVLRTRRTPRRPALEARARTAGLAHARRGKVTGLPGDRVNREVRPDLGDRPAMGREAAGPAIGTRRRPPGTGERKVRPQVGVSPADLPAVGPGRGAPLVLGVRDDDLAVRELDLVAGAVVHDVGRGDDPGRLSVGPDQVVADL